MPTMWGCRQQIGSSPLMIPQHHWGLYYRFQTDSNWKKLRKPYQQKSFPRLVVDTIAANHSSWEERGGAQLLRSIKWNKSNMSGCPITHKMPDGTKLAAGSMHGKRKEREQVWSFAQEENIQTQFGCHLQLQIHTRFCFLLLITFFLLIFELSTFDKHQCCVYPLKKNGTLESSEKPSILTLKLTQQQQSVTVNLYSGCKRSVDLNVAFGM